MTRKEALEFIHNYPDEVICVKTLIDVIGQQYFDELCSMGFITSNLGHYYRLTQLGRQYLAELYF